MEANQNPNQKENPNQKGGVKVFKKVGLTKSRDTTFASKVVLKLDALGVGFSNEAIAKEFLFQLQELCIKYAPRKWWLAGDISMYKESPESLLLVETVETVKEMLNVPQDSQS